MQAAQGHELPTQADGKPGIRKFLNPMDLKPIPGCSEPYPTWLWILPGMGSQEPLWAKTTIVVVQW